MQGQRTTEQRKVFSRSSRLPLVIVLFTAIALLLGCVPRFVAPPPESSLIAYAAPAREFSERLRIARASLDAIKTQRVSALPKSKSPWGSRWLAAQRADTMRNGPWTTRLYIFDSSDAQSCVIVEAHDHANGGVDYHWLNEKLLFVRCWWGRIVSTDLVLDIHTARAIYIEDANYFKLAYGQPE